MNTATRWAKVFAVAVMAAVLYMSLDQYHMVGPPVARLPDFELQTLDGGTFSSKDLQGRVTVINFFATWCGPCNAEMPMLERYSRKLRAKGGSLVAVSAGGDDRLAVRAFASDHNLHFPVALEGDQVLAALRIGSLPTTALVDRNGRVRRVFVGMVNERALSAAVDELLADDGA